MGWHDTIQHILASEAQHMNQKEIQEFLKEGKRLPEIRNLFPGDDTEKLIRISLREVAKEMLREGILPRNIKKKLPKYLFPSVHDSSLASWKAEVSRELKPSLTNEASRDHPSL